MPTQIQNTESNLITSPYGKVQDSSMVHLSWVRKEHKNCQNSQSHHSMRGRIGTVMIQMGGLTCVFKYFTGFFDKENLKKYLQQAGLLFQYLNNLATSLAFHLAGSNI